MVAESLKQAIAGELHRLRKAPGPLNAAKMVNARAIVRGLGADDPNVALTRLVDLAGEHPDDRDIQALMASLGWGSTSVSVLDRLSDYAAAQFVDTRTARRWADAGLKKLVLIILGTEPWAQPRIRQIVRQRGDEIQVGLDLRLPANLRMNAPQLFVGDNEFEIDTPPIAQKPKEQRFQAEFATIGMLTELPIGMRLRWFGEKYPSYETVVHGSEKTLFRSWLRFNGLHTVVALADGPTELAYREAPEDGV